MLVFALATTVYAEQEDKVNVPFDYSSKYCELNEVGDKYVCEWNPFPEVEVAPEVSNPISSQEQIPCEETFTCEKVPVDGEVISRVDQTPGKDTQFEKDLERFKIKAPKSPAQAEYFELLKELATCSRGTGTSSLIQDYDRYEVSTTWVNTEEAYLKSLDLTGPHSVLKKAIEECIAQHTILQPVILGQWYENRVPYVGYIEPSHNERKNVLALETHPSDVLTERNYFDANVQAYKAICEHNLYHDKTKKYYGCFEHESVNLGGEIVYQSPAIHRYNEYMQFEQSVNTSKISDRKGVGPVDTFIIQNGGYEKAIEKIKWKQHFDETDLVEMEKSWDAYKGNNTSTE